MQTVTLHKSKTLNHLVRLAQKTENGNNIQLATEIKSIFTQYAAESENDSEKMVASLMLKALQSRLINHSTNEHLYLKTYDIPQIKLFNILIEKFPFVKYSQQIVNHQILQRIGDAPEACIIDIGIGQGTQMMQVLQQCQNKPNLKKLKIVGIEPNAEALREAGRQIGSFSTNATYDLEYTGYQAFAEQFDYKQLGMPDTKTIVNASLALHHIQDSHKRNETLKNIRTLHPEALLLIEPNVNHMEISLSKRIVHCYHHYYNLFRVIDLLNIDQQDQCALKHFFGREIDDVIGKDENDRYERHELAANWIDRLQHSGFELQSDRLEIPETDHCGVRIKQHAEGFLGFSFDTETILAIMCAISHTNSN